ncbi:ribonuclease R [Permianibacter sp. IMCC34836]|uniref:ribonuclease R n=1 Tax=Permianibacter fluminis TaxID=2738515 RepID=UPI00155799E2|nr:ribonuclease R [Permianibacter fluminis]NQD38967.1 ribonuclease R [Permianibacter fluminis]
MARKPPADPHFDREQAKYDNPIPSREFILSFLTEKGAPLPFPAILNGLGLYSEDHEVALERRLKAMARDGQLVQNRRGLWCLPGKMDVKPGRIEGHRDGFGFVILDEGGDDWVLNEREMRKAMHGDRVLVAAQGRDRRGRIEALIVEVLGATPRHVVGRFHRQRGLAFVQASDTRISQDLIVPPGDEGGANDGQMVVVELAPRVSALSQPLAKVVEVLGDHLAPGMEIEVAIRQFDLPHQFPPAVEKEIAALAPVVQDADKKDRVDLRTLPLVTIDGEDAKDFDDAVYCERKKAGGWRLWVAIADVSHYVRRGSALDVEALNRGNSVYFPGFVIPMLPELLSNGLCSLKPDVDRLCLVCEMTVSDAGSLSSYRFYPAVMRSQQRFTYTRVWALLNGEPVQSEKERELLPALQELQALYQALADSRRQRGAIELDTRETKVLFNAERKIDRIVPVVRNDAHRLIEECMILANVAAARFLNKHEMPALYRVHQGPNLRKLEALREQLGMLGLALGGGAEPTPKDYAMLMSKIAARPDADTIQVLLLRSLTQAVYQPEMEPHFGLALTAYAHFTSPIRRYPDLVVHRGIKAILASEALATKTAMAGNEGAVRYDTAELEAVGSSNSMTERRADEATRDVTSWLKCEYMRDKLGETFAGRVTAVVGFGLFVELDEVFVEGLVHISSLRNDYYHFDAARQTLTGERSHEQFSLGDRIQVRVAEVDLDQRKIDFQFIERVRVGANTAATARSRTDEPTDAEMKAQRMAAIRKALARDGAGTLPDKVLREGGGRGNRERSDSRGQRQGADAGASKKAGSSAGRKETSGKPARAGGKASNGKASTGKSGASKSGASKSSAGKSGSSKTGAAGKSGAGSSAVGKAKKRGRR